MNFLKSCVNVSLAVSLSSTAFAGKEEAAKWISKEFQPSTLSKSEQKSEMDWFIKASRPFKGMEINV